MTVSNKHPVTKASDDAKMVLVRARPQLVGESDPFGPIARSSAALFGIVDEDDAKDADWNAEEEAWNALALAVISLNLRRVGELYRSRLRSWWASASTEAREQAIRVAIAICDR